jgi:hypothetical protein
MFYSSKIRRQIHGTGGAVPVVLQLSTRWTVVNFVARLVTAVKGCQYALNKRLPGPQKRSERFDEGKNFLTAVDSNTGASSP